MRTIENLHEYQKKAVNHQCANPHSMIWLCPGLGKQQPNSEPVLTPTGWRSIGSLRPGDYVIGRNGKPTEIIGVFPQGVSEVVEITFTDGAKTRVGWEHLWYVQNPNQKKRGQTGHVMTTRELVDSGLTRSMGNRDDSYWYIPMVEPVDLPHANLPIDPYMMGVILGDGTVTSGGSTSLCTDIEIINSIGASLLRPHDTCDYVGYGSINGIYGDMCAFGLNGKRSWEKFIPPEYITASAEQRLALLQGLCDTDGSPITCGGGLEFSSTSEALVDGLLDITRSLGGVGKKSDFRITTHQGGDGRPSWRLNIKLPPELTPFRLKRKLDKWIRPTKYPPIRKMVSHRILDSEESTCIKVAAPDSLYVTRDYIVTHNTCITLTSAVHLLNTKFLKGIIIVAPIRVIRLVWKQEALKWEHTKHLRFSSLVGTRDQRTRALLRPADIYLINYENLGWLAETLQTYFIKKGLPIPVDGLVWDEVSKCKNSNTQRVKSVKKILDHFKWTTGLTGTPASNGYKDLHGQFLVVDKGQRLGTSKTAFKSRFYKKVGPFKEVAYEDTEETIKKLIGDITLEMSAADYNPLPDMIVNNVEVELPLTLRAMYDKMEKEFFLALDSGTEIEVFNQASLTNKCLQFSSGAMYPIPGVPLWEPIHDLKLDALEDIIDEQQGNPVLCSYAYRSDAERIMARFKHLDPINLTECKSESSLLNAMNRWKRGDCALMIGHPASMGHGIDGLQQQGHTLVWFGLTWSLDLYEQFNARLRRQGQGVPVTCHRIMCRDTLDQAQALALDEKAKTQDGLRNAIKQYRKLKE